MEEKIYFSTNFQNLVLFTFYAIYQFDVMVIIKSKKLLIKTIKKKKKSSLIVIDISCNNIMQKDRLENAVNGGVNLSCHTCKFEAISRAYRMIDKERNHIFLNY